MTALGGAPGDAQALTAEGLVAAFRRGEVVGSEGPLEASAARVTARSVVLLTPRSALKLRRPRRVLALDMTTRTLRAWGTEQELWIGRRMAPTVYLGDASLRWDGAGFELVAGLLTAEPVVAMMRLPEARRADEVLAETPTVAALRPALERIAAFHEAAPLHRAHDGWGAPGRVRARWREALAALPTDGLEAPLSTEARAGLSEETEAWLDALDGDLVHRVMEGRIRHLHGDLRLEHIYLTDPVGIIDPAEDGDDFHWSDTAEDIAVVVMELDALGHGGLAAEARDLYAGATWDRTLSKVLPLFQRLVAIRRAAAELALAGHVPAHDRPACVARARFFTDLALSYRL